MKCIDPLLSDVLGFEGHISESGHRLIRQDGRES